jgi:hypothetical protein
MLGAADALDEVEPTRHALIAIVHDENACTLALMSLRFFFNPKRSEQPTPLTKLSNPGMSSP